MRKKESPLTESAAKVEAAHDKVVKSRKDLTAKRALFHKAQLVNQSAEAEYKKHKETHSQNLIEKV